MILKEIYTISSFNQKQVVENGHYNIKQTIIDNPCH